MVADTLAAYGGLDLLHNNAAAINLSLTDQDVVTMELETWYTSMRVNLDGVMLGCRFAIPAMLERGGGSIVNTASVAATYGSRSLAAYGTSKAGVVALTRYVATAYADRNIRVNAVAPGVVVDRDLQESLGGPLGDTLASITEGHLVGRLGYPEEIATAVAYLLSDEAGVCHRPDVHHRRRIYSSPLNAIGHRDENAIGNLLQLHADLLSVPLDRQGQPLPPFDRRLRFLRHHRWHQVDGHTMDLTSSYCSSRRYRSGGDAALLVAERDVGKNWRPWASPPTAPWAGPPATRAFCPGVG